MVYNVREHNGVILRVIDGHVRKVPEEDMKYFVWEW